MRRSIYVIFALFILSISRLGLSSAESHMIKNVPYYPMLDGYCAMTALRMNLSYYGIDVDQSLLLNLGWNYGFFFMPNPYYTIAYPCTDPPSEIVHVSPLLGFKATLLTHRSLDEAKASLVKYISKDIPVIVQWIPHTVLAYGFENNGETIIVHDPGDPSSSLISKGQWYPLGKGANIKSRMSEWVTEPYYWNYRQFQMVVVQPDTKQPKIDWKKIWKRNAEKTLGTDADAYLNYSGIKGMRSLADGIKNHFNQNEQKFSETLRNFELTFQLGVGFRRNASAFLSGQGVALNNPNLSGASKCFLESAHLFRKGYNLLTWLRSHPDQQTTVEKELVEIILKIIGSEEKAANFLLKAATIHEER